MIPLVLLLQAAAATPAAPPPERWSILIPPPEKPCAPSLKPGDKRDDIVICATAEPSLRLPYPDEIEPSTPQPSNRYLTGSGALAAQSTPCAIASKGCTVGFGPPVVPMIKGAVDLAKRAFRKKPDKTGRVAIPLDDPAPTGRLER